MQYVITAAGVGNQSEPVKAYSADPVNRHDAALTAAGIDSGNKIYDYTMGMNGFAARMSAAEAARKAADDIVFLFTADAGVFCAPSAGNSCPGAATVGGPGTVPWITTVGANTRRQLYEGEVRFGNGKVGGDDHRRAGGLEQRPRQHGRSVRL
jgi:hypothetical protein